MHVIAAALGLTALAAPVAACADVLQIEREGARWVAGGPVMPEPALGAATIDADTLEMLSDGTGFHPASFTGVAEAAGPERFRARVAELAAKYDISPTLLEAVVWQESRWNTAARSPVGARGLTQLMPGTARQMGVDPADPMANLEGGARYLRMQLDAFGGDIERALAAYNAGPARVQRAGGIPAIRETQMYVASIMSHLTDPVRK
ncbi:lytic transglycosylase domain-containing protein [Novosphingobium sp. 9U]|uniref:lytic transglycosylase domain-containing protein n=1 Tax=Novosphingobium sp. 9U TaxID=2653158 RepID=UPI00135BAB4F|nr:lytic transglycosylase domain-containing protein [Novosphingobium sp. 9U]